jgi:hypothetical protein
VTLLNVEQILGAIRQLSEPDRRRVAEAVRAEWPEQAVREAQTACRAEWIPPRAFSAEAAAALLNVPPALLEASLQSQQVKGIQIGDEWRVSIYTLAELLHTTSETCRVPRGHCFCASFGGGARTRRFCGRR